MDTRYKKLADVLINYSTSLKRGENVLIEAIEIPNAFTKALIQTAFEAGANPCLWIKDNQLLRELLVNASTKQLELISENELALMKKMDAYVGVRGGMNINELSDVPSDRMKLYQEYIWKRVHIEQRVKHTKWTILRFPNPAFAQQAGMSTEAFTDFFFDVCTMDYAKMARAIEPLKALMEETDQVHIEGPGTDLTFSIKDIPVVPCAGKHNIPDGEVFTAPVRNSVNGKISFNTSTVYQGVSFSDVQLTFKEGKVVEASADKPEKIDEILNTDEGARYVGEFSFGLNPFITKPMLDILFDEKITGSFHFTPGNAYDDADNGNRSAVHWDMVLIQTPEKGGGTISLDGKVIRKDGRFVLDELQGLNPENLK